jgi:quercetin dioxygenase-like cupin family protein
MNKIVPVDIINTSFDIHKDLSISPRKRAPGPPVRIDGMTVGIVTMEHSAPHGGEVHPDGDEILYVISGKVRVIGDSVPDAPLELAAGQSCIVRAGEWHKVDVVEKTQLLHITPGPNGDHRPE